MPLNEFRIILSLWLRSPTERVFLTILLSALRAAYRSRDKLSRLGGDSRQPGAFRTHASVQTVGARTAKTQLCTLHKSYCTAAAREGQKMGGWVQVVNESSLILINGCLCCNASLYADFPESRGRVRNRDDSRRPGARRDAGDAGAAGRRAMASVSVASSVVV